MNFESFIKMHNIILERC